MHYLKGKLGNCCGLKVCILVAACPGKHSAFWEDTLYSWRCFVKQHRLQMCYQGFQWIRWRTIYGVKFLRNYQRRTVHLWNAYLCFEYLHLQKFYEKYIQRVGSGASSRGWKSEWLSGGRMVGMFFLQLLLSSHIKK